MNITIQDIVDQAARATDIVSQVRGRMLAPNARKNPPVFNASQLAALCEVDKSQITYRTSKGTFPGHRQCNGLAARILLGGSPRMGTRLPRQRAAAGEGAGHDSRHR